MPQPDTDKESATVDPLVALEKTTDAKNHMDNVQRPRIESLQDASEHYNADPYSLSIRARKRFREEKKVEQKKRKSDDLLKGRYGLPETLKLVEDDEKAIEEAKFEWEQAKQEQMRASKRKKTTLAITSIPSTSFAPSTNSASSSLDSLRARILQNTAKKSGVFQSRSAPSPARQKQSGWHFIPYVYHDPCILYKYSVAHNTSLEGHWSEVPRIELSSMHRT